MRPFAMRAPCLAVLAAAVMSLACEGDRDIAEPPHSPGGPTSFDVTLVSSVPAAGGTLILARTNNEPVALSVTFSVSVPISAAGSYNWNTAVQADYPPVVPVVTTAFQAVTLAPGVQTVTITQFHTTNAYCGNPLAARASSSIDVDVRAATASLAQGGAQVLGKRFDVSFALQCR